MWKIIPKAASRKLFNESLKVGCLESEVPVVPVNRGIPAEAAFRVNNKMHLQAATSQPGAGYREVRPRNFNKTEYLAIER
ncbi:Hypothetical protein NGAL_HAMBI1146_27400 [Neorhizobium galegae bv. officinalis]|nr:Hypothetical protein NGAL_HAMBI490_40490 [Neorhizobium galegae bv. officinalis]CDZ38174.1 Hypothetical protein NGAL_HAMBI1146_27400 [Neorhizobium galegae bv. officinalis]